MEPRVQQITISDVCDIIQNLLNQTRVYIDIFNTNLHQEEQKEKSPTNSKKIKCQDGQEEGDVFQRFSTIVDPICLEYISTLKKSKTILGKNIPYPQDIMQEIKNFETPIEKDIKKKISEKRRIFQVIRPKIPKKKNRVMEKCQIKKACQKRKETREINENESQLDSTQYQEKLLLPPNRDRKRVQTFYNDEPLYPMTSTHGMYHETEQFPYSQKNVSPLTSFIQPKIEEPAGFGEDFIDSYFNKETSTREGSPAWDKYENRRQEFEKGLGFFDKMEYL